jgi:hypothetical protein
MRRAPSIVALLAALVACAALATAISLELRSATPDASPREAIEAAASDRAQARQDRFSAQDRSFDTPYDRAMVRDTVAWRAEPGAPPTTDVTIVNATPGADLAASARACAEATARATRTRVQCYAFASTEAYEYKNITADLDLAEPTAIVNLCWAVLASNQRAGGPIELSDMRPAPQTWQAQGCPDSWIGTGDDVEAAP